jgi:hypothetical protein
MVDNNSESKSSCRDCARSSVCSRLWIDSWLSEPKQCSFRCGSSNSYRVFDIDPDSHHLLKLLRK